MLVTYNESELWQQTQNCITKKLGENVAIKSSYIGLAKMANSSIFDKVFHEICIFDKRKNDIFGSKILWSLTIG